MNHIKRLLGILMVMLAVLPTFANGKGGDPNIKDVVLEHIKDSMTGTLLILEISLWSYIYL